MTKIRSCGSKRDALNTVERIRDLSEAQLWISAKLQRKVTVSIGLTQYIPGESILDLFSRADAAMYLAKTGGRNQVVVEEPVEAAQCAARGWSPRRGMLF